MKSSTQNEHEKLQDRVYAAMETGNTDQARTLVREYAEEHPTNAEYLRLAIVQEYGVIL